MDRNKTHRPVCKKTSGKTVCAPAQREAQKEEREMKKGKVHIIFGTGTWCQCSHARPEGNYDTILKGSAEP